MGDYIKRILDFIIAAISIIVFSPLFLICFIAIRMEDGGPATFSQERIGKGGKPFMIYKFRSMRVDAEKDGPALCQNENDNRRSPKWGSSCAHTILTNCHNCGMC